MASSGDSHHRRIRRSGAQEDMRTRACWTSSDRPPGLLVSCETSVTTTREVASRTSQPLSGFLRRVDLLLDLRAIDRVAVAGERLLPGGDRVGRTVLLLSQIAEMLLDHG